LCKRQAENLIKVHKRQLASDRTGCCLRLANKMRLILHTGAYWLMLTMRDAIPNAHSLPKAGFAQTRPAGHLNGFARSSCRLGSLFRRRIDPATCHHDRPRRTMTTRAVGALLNQSDQLSACGQSLIKPAVQKTKPQRMLGADQPPKSAPPVNTSGAHIQTLLHGPRIHGCERCLVELADDRLRRATLQKDGKPGWRFKIREHRS
jgi:Transposase DDE domain group 1